MIFPETFESKLGFDQIRQRLKGYCLSNSGAEYIDRMRFSTDAEFIKILLKQNLEFRQILETENFPSQHFFDAQDWLKKIALEGNYLESAEFLNLAQALDTILSCKNFITKSKEKYPQLFKLSEPVILTETLAKSVYNKIDD